MTATDRKFAFRDPLYSIVQLDEELAGLITQPIIQRLRHVRMSNIDSVDMPCIANLSRYEHTLGVAYLACKIGFRSKLPHFDDVVLRASALLHDWAITAFGHLVEEALQYVGTGFDHQERLLEITSGRAIEETLGTERQILAGRESGLSQWARAVIRSGTTSDQLLSAITDHIRGRGRLGRLISGDIDLDNIDNVFRMAYHLGLPVDKGAPVRLAMSIIDCDQSGSPIFLRSAEGDIETWRSMRSAVYQNLMLAPHDFIGKTMMLYATVLAFERGQISVLDWSLTDVDYLHLLLSSNMPEIKTTAERWIAGELWDFTSLQWMSGERPLYSRIRKFSGELSKRLDRTCFAYGIKDKRDRRLDVHFDDGHQQTLGSDPRQWVFGAGSPNRRPFTSAEVAAIFDLAEKYFGCRLVGPAISEQSRGPDFQPSLL